MVIARAYSYNRGQFEGVKQGLNSIIIETGRTPKLNKTYQESESVEVYR